MDYAVNLAVLLLYPSIGSLHRRAIGGIGLDIERSKTKLRQPIQLGLDGFVLRAPADPHDLRLIDADHLLAPGLADTAGSADHHIDATLPVQGSLCHRQ